MTDVTKNSLPGAPRALLSGLRSENQWRVPGSGRMRWHGAVVLITLLLCAAFVPHGAGAEPAMTGAPNRRPGTLVLREHFGVSHPLQLVEFKLDQDVQPRTGVLKSSDGQATPYQVLSSKKMVLLTDLPAKMSREWNLSSARPAAEGELPNAVVVTLDSTRATVANGLTGVIVPLAATGDNLPAPIQGLRYRDGAWTARGPNVLSCAAKALHLRWVETGPLKAVAELTYDLGGTNYYRCTLELQAAQPSILIEEEATAEVKYTLNVWEGLRPNEARYEGHHSTSPTAGREPGGVIYRPWHERPQMEALVDLTGTREFKSLPVWDPWCFDTGWHWQMYNKDAGPEGNVFGVFAGRVSRAVCPNESGVNIWCELGAAGLTVRCKPAGAPRARFQWGLFAGIKGQDLNDPVRPQGIDAQMNIHAGINLNKIAAMPFEYADPPGGYGSLYLPREATARLIGRLQGDDGQRQRLRHADSYLAELIDLLADRTGQRVGQVMARLEAKANDLLRALVHEHGIYSFRAHYWHGGGEMVGQLMWIDQVLASPFTSAEQKAKAKAIAVLFASILWDNDFVPLDNSEGFNLGTPNMPVQQWACRNQFAVFLATQPEMAARIKRVVEGTSKTLASDINEHGAHMASSHYIHAGMSHTLTLMQQLKTAGVADLFADVPRVAAFAEFLMQLSTPPEARFGGRRKLVCVAGDGSTESSELFGQLATGLADATPNLSRRLMRMWRAQGAKHFNTTLKIDEDLRESPANLATANIPGYGSVFRSRYETPHETALWFLNGNHYWDHSHQDQGEVETPAGRLTPTPRIWGSKTQERASSGRVVELKPGVSRLGFTGQTWPAHHTQGIDWDLYVVGSEPQQVLVGNWAHRWHPAPEMEDFMKANGRPFEERQHILRIRSSDGFKVFIVPYPKGRKPAHLQVSEEGGRVAVTVNGHTIRFDARGAF